MTLSLKCIVTQVVLLVVLVVYTLYGGYLFMWLEGEANAASRTKIKDVRENFIKALWERSRVIRGGGDKDQWGQDVDRLVKEFQQNVFLAVSEYDWDGEEVGEAKSKWTMASSILYCLTLITTIGYGNITPQTREGKLFTMFYSALGIPLNLLFLANVGSVLAMGIRALFSKGQKNFKKKEHKKLRNESARVPFWLSLQIITVWILLGALVFSAIEESWDFLTAAYFSFITLSTIGLGDYVPGTEYGKESNGKLLFTSFYVVIGMALSVTTFDLIQEEVMRKIRWLARQLGCTSKPEENRRKRKNADEPPESPKEEEENKQDEQMPDMALDVAADFSRHIITTCVDTPEKTMT